MQCHLVGRLCDRVSSSTLLDDRRDAVRALKSLSKKYRVEVGSQALPHLIEVLRSDSNDDEIIAYALETLFNLSTIDVDDEGDMVAQPETILTFIESFIAVTENVILALNMIEKDSFAARWAAVRLLTSLLRGKPNELQQIILIMPMGISRVMDLLAESREVIRNDALLALIELTRGNSNIQKIVAFENGFESIFNIIREEGSSDGGVVVEDCLLLLLHLLKSNTSNQQFFKEGSLIQHLTPFFDIDPESPWSAQKNANFHLMLKVIRTLVSPSNPSNMTSSCQLAMQHCLLLRKLSDLLMATGIPTDILTETINTVSELIRGCNENQQYFASVMAPWDPPRPALVVLLMSMVNAQQPFQLRCAVLYCFQCFLHKNAMGQSQIISTLLPSSLEPQDVSVGQLLCGGLFSVSDSLTNWLAATALSHALRSNNDAKHQLLRVQLATAPGNPPITLIRQITNIVHQTTFLQTRVGLLCLLCGWLTNCPVAVSHFLDNSTTVSFLLSQVAENGTDLEFVMHGVCALLLGICIIDNDGSVSQYTKESLIELIVARVGIERFCDALNCVPQHDIYTKALQKPQPSADEPDHLLLNHTFAKLFKTQEDVIIKTVSNLEDVKKEEEVKAAMKAHDSIVNEYKTLIREQDSKLEAFKGKCNKLEADLTSSASLLSERDAQVQQLKDQYNLLKLTQGTSGDETTAVMTKRIDDLNQQIIAKDNELKSCQQTISELKAQGDVKLSENPSADEKSQKDIISMQQELNRLSITLKEKEEELAKMTNASTSAVVQQADAASDALIAEKVAMQSQLADSKHKLDCAVVEKNQIKEENASLKQKLAEAENQIEELQKTASEHVAKYIESNSVCETIKKEQDDLLILLSDQEEKLSTYKKKLRGLGAEVSSDEGEDEYEGGDLNEEESETNNVNGEGA
ncbi:general vesicular transport factor p115-like isoform X2 [Clavelina lepadiformis]|uniref:general vesicular transport factor p115-like isoform X2 n=1 Tax=Clavelina lepadiformis TaxID=159417 RepID=UPI004042C52C